MGRGLTVADADLPSPAAAMRPVLPPVSADRHLPRPASRADEPPHLGDVDDDGLERAEVQVGIVDRLPSGGSRADRTSPCIA